jgi:hypothetical protein
VCSRLNSFPTVVRVRYHLFDFRWRFVSFRSVLHRIPTNSEHEPDLLRPLRQPRPRQYGALIGRRMARNFVRLSLVLRWKLEASESNPNCASTLRDFQLS